MAIAEEVHGIDWAYSTPEFLRKAVNLRWVQAGSAGVERYLALPELADNDAIVFTNMQGIHGPTIADHVFAMILALRRQLRPYHEAAASGAWGGSTGFCYLFDPLPLALSGSTLGLIGYGGLARQVERIALAFDMRVLVAERRGAATVREGRVPFEQAVRQSDVLSPSAPSPQRLAA